MITITDGTRMTTISDRDIEIAQTECLDLYVWIVNAVDERCRRATDKIVLETTEYNPRKMAKSRKLESIKDVVLKSVADKNAAFLIDPDKEVV